MDGRPALGRVEDLATLAKLDDSVLLEELRARYRNNDIYTYVGDILIAVNPFREIPGLYENSESQRYFLEQKSSNPPHIYAIADSTYQNIIGYGGRVPQNQCVLISGESGAGKTESTKLIIKQLVELCRGNTQLEQQILQVNPLLESFGNAQTLMNDNSSRFGKYIQLMFKEGHVMGAKISEYLLEKSRVVRQGNNEENFHIFYYMFAGLSNEYKAAHHLQSADKFRYLTNGASSLRRDPALMKNRYEELVNAMDMVGFTDEEQMSTFNMIASVLHLGNVTFDMDDNDAAFVEDENGAVKYASQLLGINTQEVAGTLTAMVTFTRGEQVKRNYSAEQARDACDAMAKAIYGRLFGWIVNKVNQLLAPPVLHGEHREIGILDIFGFEHFEKNSFEQACINLANEQLQFFFNQHVFKLEQDEYTKEGIDWTEIKFVDNLPLLNLFLNKPIGILSLLDEETHFPRGSDRSFVEKLDIHFHGNGYYVKSQQSTSGKFTIHHYAGKVTYDSSSWLEKNRDTLPPGVMEMLQGSTDDLVKLMFRGQVTRTGSLALQCRKSTSRRTRRSKKISVDGRKRKITVGGQFKNSLQILMERMMSSSPVFVRCLKPNHVKVPGKFDETYIRDQLLYTGMLETIKIRREGFAVRPSFPEFVEKYKIILCKPSLEGNKQNCIQILKASKITGWQVGKTKVFMKYYHLEQLSEIFKVMGKSALHLQRIVRGFLARQYVKVRKQEAQKQAMRVNNFLSQINNLSIEFNNHQHSARVHDQSIPPSFFKGEEAELPPPPVPSFYGVATPRSSGNKYMEPVAPTSREFGTQADSSDSDQFSDDEFKPVSSTQFGTPGTRQATVKWFKETQAQQIYDPAVSSFIAEWFHGVISRRTSEILLGSKPVGCFLIRVSESRFGYSLSFRAEGRVRHYMIDQLPNKKFVIVGEKKVHRTLKDLVDYYSSNHLSNWDGFLSDPCGQEDGNCDYQELIADNYYFKLEQEQQASKVRGSRNPGAPPQRDPTMSGPPLPDRNYTIPKNQATKTGGRSSAAMSGRPLPKRPDEAHQRLLQNQAFSDGAVAQWLLSSGSQGSALSIHMSQGIGVMMGVYISGRVSGGHINPAVTVAQAFRGRLPWIKVPFYLAGQYGGSFLASLILYLVYNDALYHYDGGVRSSIGPTGTAGIWATYPRHFLSVTNSIADQIFGAAVLLICVSALSDKRNMNPSSGLLPVCTGLVVFVINTTFCFNCGCANNPARDLSPRLFTAMAGWGNQPFSFNRYSYFWVPVLGPHLGAILGTFVYDLCIGFHWPDENGKVDADELVWIPRKRHKCNGKQRSKNKSEDFEHLLETSV